MNTAVETKLATIRDLPTLPTVIAKLNSAVADINSDAKRIVMLLRDDPAISAKILRVVNSSFYAGSEPTSSMQLAVARIGMVGIRNLATAAAVFGAFRHGPQDAFDRKEFWRHCILCGVAATVLFRCSRARLTRFYTDDILHLAGLVHDMGRIVLDLYFHDPFLAALDASAKGMYPLLEAERRLIGTDHAEVGAWLAQKWNLSPAIQQVIRWHHEPASASAEFRELAALCNAANYICNFQQLGWSGDSAPLYQAQVWDQLGLSPNEAQDISEKIKIESRESEMLSAFT
jgi:HD-like signal output (HDOD) protein